MHNMAKEADAPYAAVPGETNPQRRARHWDRLRRLSSVHCTIEQFLEQRSFERGPWLAVAFGAGISGWAVLPGPWHWGALLALCGAVAMGALVVDREAGLDRLRQAGLAVAIMVAAGCITIWSKSALVGQPAIQRPMVARVEGEIMDRRDEAADERVRLLLVAHVDGLPRMVKVRINVPLKDAAPEMIQGATVRLQARLMPPAQPMLPGSYDFAMAAWFQGLAATGSALSQVEVIAPARGGATLGRIRQQLADHVRSRLAGSPGTIAAALASGDRGAIAQADEDAMRDAGLTHLLSISGLHVSAVIAAAYVLTASLVGLFPWVVLRVRLPLVAALAGAFAGIGYTLITGAEVPTIRSVAGSLLVLAALALGRDPLSMRMVAVAAFAVMLFWPEAVLGPSFQMSFASVIAIIAFHDARPARKCLQARDEGWPIRAARHLVMLLVTGMVIELALTPIALFHFHRAGLYGAAANVVAIPLTTFMTMPLIGLALFLDLAGGGAPAWWLAGKSLEFLLWLAHVTASLPGAVTMMPTMARGTFALYLCGLLWMALWTGRLRFFGFLPIACATVLTLRTPVPDILISGDGHHIGITGEGTELLMLRPTKGDFVRDNLLETAGIRGRVLTLDQWRGAKCNDDFCAVTLVRGGRRFVLLMTRGRDSIDTLALAAACERSDIVVADRRLPSACAPRLLKADRTLLDRTGGMTISLSDWRNTTVAENRGQHGWWVPPLPYPRRAVQAPTVSGQPSAR